MATTCPAGSMMDTTECRDCSACSARDRVCMGNGTRDGCLVDGLDVIDSQEYLCQCSPDSTSGGVMVYSGYESQSDKAKAYRFDGCGAQTNMHMEIDGEYQFGGLPYRMCYTIGGDRCKLASSKLGFGGEPTSWRKCSGFQNCSVRHPQTTRAWQSPQPPQPSSSSSSSSSSSPPPPPPPSFSNSPLPIAGQDEHGSIWRDDS
jgi:hypothetical protein